MEIIHGNWGDVVSDKQSRKTFRLRVEEMIKKLREQILSGEYSVGEYLPSELDLSKMFQLSNNSVRNGLDTLVAEGLVEKIPRVGNRVKAPDEDAQTVIRFGYHPVLNSQSELPYLLEEFQNRYPHIRVQTVPITESYEYVRNFLDNDLIDVFTTNYYLYQGFVDANALDLLEPQEPFEDMYPFLKKGFLHEAVMYTQPFVFSPVILCYNREHFSQLQIPEPDSSWSWDDLIRYAAQLSIKNERFGFHFHLINPNRWINFLVQTGEAFDKDEKGHYRIKGTKLLDGIEKLREILYAPQVYPLMLYSASDADPERLFRNQQVSIIMTTYFALNELKDVNFEFDVAPLPYLYDFNTLLISLGLSINKRSKVKTAAKQFIDFIISEEAQRVIQEKTYSIPAHKQMAQTGNSELVRPTRYQMFKEIIPSFSSFTDTKLTLKQLDELLLECKLYWTGLKSKEKLISSVEELLNRNTK